MVFDRIIRSSLSLHIPLQNPSDLHPLVSFLVVKPQQQLLLVCRPFSVLHLRIQVVLVSVLHLLYL